MVQLLSLIADYGEDLGVSVPTKAKSDTEASRADKITVQLGACQKVVDIELEYFMRIGFCVKNV